MMDEKPTYEELQKGLRELEQERIERNCAGKELRDSQVHLNAVTNELKTGLSELIGALEKISSGDPSVRIPETSQLEMISKLKSEVNKTAESLEEIVDLCHEFAIGLAEHFDVIYRVSRGDLGARISGVSKVELLEQLKHLTNGMIEKIVKMLNEKKRIEESLRNSERRYRTVFDNAGDAIFLHDLEGKMLDVNKVACERLGYSREELLQMTPYSLDDPYYAKEVGKRIKEVELKKEIVFDSVHLGKYEEGIPVEIISRYIEYDGSPAILSVARDITERRSSMRALRESEERYRCIVENSHDAILMLGDNYQFVYVNPQFCELTGYSAEEVMYKDFRQFVDEEQKDFLESMYERRKRGEDVPSRYTFDFTRKDGELRKVEIRATIARAPQGQERNIGFLLDITEREEAVRKLRESEERLRAIFEANPDPVVVYSMEGHAEYLNPAFSKVFGWTLDELRGKRVPFVPEDQEEITREKIKVLYDSGSPLRIDTRRVTKQGDIIDVDLSAAPIKAHDGEPVGMVVNLTDVTEKKKLEAQFQQAQKMEAIGTLAGGIAHNFNNVLMGVQMQISLIKKDKDPDHPDLKRLKAIERYVRDATELTKDLLGFARGGKYEIKPTDLNELIEHENQVFGRTKKEIIVWGEYQRDLWTVEVDRGQMRQVLMNLYLNAWQAMPGGGEVAVQTENVFISDDHLGPFDLNPGRYVKISVTDNGMGMDEETRQKIFDPFFTTQEAGRGTGLGLASVYGIVKNHGGFVNVYSEEGLGTTFTIYLPASGVEFFEDAPETEQQEFHSGKGTVLLVDDEEMITEGIGELLEIMGYRVLVAKNGKEGIEVYRENQSDIDVVILDMIMQGMGGRETFDTLKEVDPEVKVLLSSGYSINEQAKEMLARGCYGFIQKPFDINSLSQKIMDIMEKE